MTLAQPLHCSVCRQVVIESPQKDIRCFFSKRKADAQEPDGKLTFVFGSDLRLVSYRITYTICIEGRFCLVARHGSELFCLKVTQRLKVTYIFMCIIIKSIV